MIKKIKIGIGLLLASAIVLMVIYYAVKLQKNPQQMFQKKLIGLWHNLPMSDKTYIRFNEMGKCVYHTNGKSNKCIYQVKGMSTVVIAVKTSDDATKAFQKMGESSSFDLREATLLGMEIGQINISNNVMTGQMKGISGTRETTAKPLRLKKIKEKDQ